jgi:hypothetical protein
LTRLSHERFTLLRVAAVKNFKVFLVRLFGVFLLFFFFICRSLMATKMLLDTQVCFRVPHITMHFRVPHTTVHSTLMAY